MTVRAVTTFVSSSGSFLIPADIEQCTERLHIVEIQIFPSTGNPVEAEPEGLPALAGKPQFTAAQATHPGVSCPLIACFGPLMS